jgi:hypothetical protein
VKTAAEWASTIHHSSNKATTERIIQAAINEALEEAVQFATRIGSAPESDYTTAAAIAVGIASLKPKDGYAL